MSEFLAKLQQLSLDERKQFLDHILGELNDKEIASTNEDDIRFIQVFRKHLKDIYDLAIIPTGWFVMINHLYNNDNYPLFVDWLTTIL